MSYFFYISILENLRGISLPNGGRQLDKRTKRIYQIRISTINVIQLMLLKSQRKNTLILYKTIIKY